MRFPVHKRHESIDWEVEKKKLRKIWKIIEDHWERKQRRRTFEYIANVNRIEWLRRIRTHSLMYEVGEEVMHNQ